MWPHLHFLLLTLVSGHGPDSSGLAENLEADARRCERRLFLGSAPSLGLRSSDGVGWHSAQGERDSRQQGLQPGGSCWDLLSLGASLQTWGPHPQHSHVCAHYPPPRHTHTPIPSLSPTVASGHTSAHHPDRLQSGQTQGRGTSAQMERERLTGPGLWASHSSHCSHRLQVLRDLKKPLNSASPSLQPRGHRLF